jgi:NTE family protein
LKQNEGENQERRSVGLALSGGGTRGLSHIGVLKALEREGIQIDYLAGASMGGVIGAGYANGMSPAELEEEAGRVSRLRDVLRLADPAIPNAGLLRGQRLQEYFESLLGDCTFAELKLPLALVAVDLNTRQEVIITDGSVALGLRATTSVPGLFMPLELDGMRLVDGGLLNNLPIDVARKMGASIILAVDVDPDPDEISTGWEGQYRWMPNGVARTFTVLDESTRLMMRVIQDARMDQFPPDVVLRPRLPAGFNIFSGYNRTDELIEAGERAVDDVLPELRAIFAKETATQEGDDR